MTMQKPRSRFLPTLTEVVQPAAVDSSQGLAASGSLAIDDGDGVQGMGEAELRAEIQRQVEEQLQQLLPQIQQQLERTVTHAIQQAFAAHTPGKR